MNTKTNATILSVSIIACLSLFASSLNAGTATAAAIKAQVAIDKGDLPSWWTPSLPDEIQKDVDNKGKRLAEKLKLANDAKTRKTANLIAEHYGKVWAWHKEADDRLSAGWAAWDAARDNTNGKEKDELKALAIMTDRIDPIYAEFAPQVQGLIRKLNTEIGEEKTIELLDIISRSPGAPRTYNAYLGMVPQMTDDEKEIIWNRLAQAREDSLCAWSGNQIIKIFKKYKVRNEFSIDYFGYDYKKSYSAWIKANH